MRKRMMERLRSRVGESIAEVLVALLISAVGVALLVGMIAASTRIIDRSTQIMREEYDKTSVVAHSGTTVTLTPASGTSFSSVRFAITDQVHTDSEGQEEIIFYTPVQNTSSSTSVSGAG